MDSKELELRHSGLRIRPGVVGPVTDLSAMVDKVELLSVRTHEDLRLVTALRWIQHAIIDVECARGPVPSPAVEALVEASVDWAYAVARSIASALAYRTPQQRRTAIELAAEESSMRLLMSLEPAREAARAEATDEDLRQALADLAARVDVVDRMLHARVMTAAAR